MPSQASKCSVLGNCVAVRVVLLCWTEAVDPICCEKKNPRGSFMADYLEKKHMKILI